MRTAHPILGGRVIDALDVRLSLWCWEAGLLRGVADANMCTTIDSYQM